MVLHHMRQGDSCRGRTLWRQQQQCRQLMHERGANLHSTHMHGVAKP
jgi:hypothetical protein